MEQELNTLNDNLRALRAKIEESQALSESALEVIGRILDKHADA